jgi:hypothetical protein
LLKSNARLTQSFRLLPILILFAGCGGKSNGAFHGKAVPDAVIQRTVLLDRLTLPEQLTSSITDYSENITAAERANGVVGKYLVGWTGIEREQGAAQDDNGNFEAQKLASGVWYTASGVRKALLNDDGSFATDNADLSGSYESAGEPPRSSGFQIFLQHAGTTNVGTFRYQYYNEAREYRILALHRMSAPDPAAHELNGRAFALLQDVSPNRHPSTPMYVDEALSFGPNVIALHTQEAGSSCECVRR